MAVSAVLNQMIILFLLMAVGFLCGKIKIIDPATNKRLSLIVTNVTQVALILGAVMTVENRMSWGELGLMMAIACGMYILLGLIAFLVPKALATPKDDLGTYRFMLMFGNVGFMGYPVISSVFGSDAVFYASLFNIPFNILVYSVGIILLTGGSGSKFSIKKILNAPLIASVLAVIIYVFDIPFPTVVVESVNLLGDVTIPMAMLIIGGSLAQIPIGKLFVGWRMYPVIFVKLIVSPLLLRLILGAFVTNELIMGISFLVAAMPIATNATMLTTLYGGNESLASRAVFISTALSVITIPALIYFFPM